MLCEHTHTKKNDGHDSKRLNEPKKSHTCIVHGQKWQHWKRIGSELNLMETFGTAPKKILLKAHFLRYQPQICNTTCLDYWLLFLCSFKVKHILQNIDFI